MLLFFDGNKYLHGGGGYENVKKWREERLNYSQAWLTTKGDIAGSVRQ
jgi:hypothetical protein